LPFTLGNSVTGGQSFIIIITHQPTKSRARQSLSTFFGITTHEYQCMHAPHIPLSGSGCHEPSSIECVQSETRGVSSFHTDVPAEEGHFVASAARVEGGGTKNRQPSPAILVASVTRGSATAIECPKVLAVACGLCECLREWEGHDDTCPSRAM